MTDKSWMLAIPARYTSTRFPGKPLADIYGKPMIERVWTRCARAVGADRVIVLTDHADIAATCVQLGARVEVVTEECLTGTDRIARSVELKDLDFVVNVQGDEPLVNVEHIKQVVDLMLNSEADVVNLMTPIVDESDYLSADIPKCVANGVGDLLYMSRAPIPATKDGAFVSADRQVCVYGFSKGALADFAEVKQKGPLEAAEDIEILRFLELGYRVLMRRVEAAGPGIDRPSDIEKLDPGDFL